MRKKFENAINIEIVSNFFFFFEDIWQWNQGILKDNIVYIQQFVTHEVKDDNAFFKIGRGKDIKLDKWFKKL